MSQYHFGRFKQCLAGKTMKKRRDGFNRGVRPSRPRPNDLPPSPAVVTENARLATTAADWRLCASPRKGPSNATQKRAPARAPPGCWRARRAPPGEHRRRRPPRSDSRRGSAGPSRRPARPESRDSRRVLLDRDHLGAEADLGPALPGGGEQDLVEEVLAAASPPGPGSRARRIAPAGRRRGERRPVCLGQRRDRDPPAPPASRPPTASTGSSSPTWRKISTVRGPIPSARGWMESPGRRSTAKAGTP
jgi:hypothetical protein